MKDKLKATLEIVDFVYNDIITTSEEHDNGYVDFGDFASFLKNTEKYIKKVF